MRTRRWRPLRWLLGLPFVVLLAAIALFGELRWIQADLTHRATDAMQAAGIGWAKIDFDGRDGRLSGMASSDEEQKAAITAALGNWGVRMVNDQSTLIEALEPYPWSITRDGRSVVTSGYGVTDADRKDISEAAAKQLRGLSLTQNLKLARGMPPRERWLEAISFAAAQMANLNKGKAELEDLRLTISGTASNPEAYTAVTKALANGLPAGVKLVEANISRPVVSPFTWDAAWKGRELTLSGYAPDDKIRARLVSAATSVFPGAVITDHLAIAAGEPAGFERAAMVALTQLARLEDGAASFRDGVAVLKGVAVEQDDAEAASQAFRQGLPGGFSSTEVVTFRKARVPIAKPFVWQAKLMGRTLDISGVVPDGKVKDNIAAFATKRFAGVHVTDSTSLARGAPAGFETAVTAGLEQFGRLDQGTLRVSDTTIDLTGHAPDVDTASGAKDRLMGGLPTGFTASVAVEADKPKVAVVPPKPPEPPKPAEVPKVVEQPKVAETPKPVVIAKPPSVPYVWDAVLDHGTVTISGGAPGGEARDQMLGVVASRLFGTTLVSKVQQVDAIPSTQEDWLHAIDSGLKAIGDLGGGHAHIEDHLLTVTGATTDRALPDYIAETLRRGVPSAYQVSSKVELLSAPVPPSPVPSAYETTLKYDGLHVIIEGLVPDLPTKVRFFDRLRPMFPDRVFDDRTTVKSGAPAGWYDAITQGALPLSTLASGELDLHDHDLTLKGSAEDQKVLEAARQKLSVGLPRGFGGKEELSYVPPPAPDPSLLAKKQDEGKYDVGKLMHQANELSPPECQAVLNSLLRGKVFFASGRADLDARLLQPLNDAIAIARRCPKTRVVIAGYTDSDGAPAFNQRLSAQRAMAVLRYLYQKGVANNRLTAIGYGEAQPIAPNDSPANKAKNRRIEFTVTPG